MTKTADNLRRAWQNHTGAEPSESVLALAIEEAAEAIHSLTSHDQMLADANKGLLTDCENLTAECDTLKIVNKRLTETKCMEWNTHEHTALRTENAALRAKLDTCGSAILPVQNYPEDTAEQFIQAAIDSSPEPLRELGRYLSQVLDEDQWATAEKLLLGIAAGATLEPSDVPDAVSKAMREAWQLGQEYWQQANSDILSQQIKTGETQRKFEQLLEETRAQLAQAEPRCPHCDGSGDVHRADGEWLGTCTCPEGIGQDEPAETPVVPDGWQLVPIEPTQQMCQMGQEKSWPRFPLRIVPIYQAMLKAAPKA